ncbi:hypothetical protein Tco_0872303 [Tanacetum coccineum]
MVASFGEESLGEEDASEQGRKIDDIDEGVTLVDETAENLGMFNDEEIFDAGILDCEEVFANAEQEVAAVNEVTTAGIEKVVSTAEVTTAGIEKVVSTAEVTTIGIEVTTASAITTTANDLTLAQTLMEIRSARPKVKGVMIQEQGESTTTTTRPQQQPSKDKGKGIMVELEKPTKRKVQIKLDEEAAQRLQAELQAELEEEERLAREKEEANIALIESWDNLFDRAYKRINTFEDFRTELVEGSKKRAGEELMQESAKKQKVHNDTEEDDTEEAELKDCLKIIPDEEEVTIDVVPLAVKSPSIVDWKVVKDGKKSYYQIIRADGSSKMYLVFNKMLRSFDKEDLETLYKLVKARYSSTRLVEEDRFLWEDLMTIFEPNVVDDMWRNQQEYRLLSWKLYDSCGVHCLMTNSMHIYMLVEKKYPLAPITLSKM